MTDFSIFIRIYPEYFIMNHYNCQSREFWDKTKCTRGDGDGYCVRLPEHFSIFDLNDVEDLDLYHQNLPLYETFSLSGETDHYVLYKDEKK